MDNIENTVEMNSNQFFIGPRLKKRKALTPSYQRDGFGMPTRKEIEESQYEPQISSKLGSVHDTVQLFQFRESPEMQIENSRALWVSQGLKILFYITKFIRQMKNHSTQVSFKYLNNEMVELIGDSSSDANELLKQLTKSQLFLQMVMQKINNLPTIEPDSMFKLFWDIFMLIQILINIFFIPMKLGFNFAIESQTLQFVLEILPTWTFVMDIVLNFFTAFYDKGQIHRQKAQIFERYVKFYFWWDLIIVLPFLLALFQVEFTQYIQLLRLSRVKYIVQSIIEIINPSETIQAITSLIQSVFFIMFVSHFCACLWSLIGEIQQSQGLPSWLSARQIENADWSTKYIHCLYFSTITTLTVGYGDIVPTTNIERVYVIMMALVICGVLGYTISSIGEILKQLTQNESRFKQKMLSLNNYLKFKKINKQLQLQVRKYFEYVFTMEQDSHEFGDSLMNQLTKDLKEQVAIDIYYGMLIQSRLINNTLSKKSVQKLCNFVQEQKCAPEETIALQHTQAQKLYFLQKGEIQLICDTNLRETKLALINANRFIGEREFILQSEYKYSIKTSNFCQLAYINYADFIKVVREDAQEDEKFCMMRDSLQFNEDKRNYGQVCYVCQWTHQFTDCPIIFLKINKEKVRNLCLTPFFQSRKDKDRRKRFRSPGVRQLREDAIQFLIDNSMINSEDLNQGFLDLLGYKLEVVSVHSVEKSKSFSSSENDSSKSSSKVPLNKQISINKRQSIPKIRNSLFQVFAEPDAQNLRSQNSFMSKVGNKNPNSGSRLSMMTQNRFPSSSLDKFSKATLELEMPKQISTALDQINMISQLQEEINQKTDLPIIIHRCDLDIDRQFLAKHYYPNQNFDDVLQKFKKQSTVIKTPFSIACLRRKKN